MQHAMQSTPSYATILDDIPQAQQHILIIQDEQSEYAVNLYKKYQDIEHVIYILAEHCDLDSTLNTQIMETLQHLHVGLHLVVCGDEVFLWHVNKLLRAHGLVSDEIQLLKTESQKKRVYCVHCFSLFETTADEFCDCPQCTSYLLIRSHFSERLGAYMGVSANAEELRGVQA